jgi:hypothetical protein
MVLQPFVHEGKTQMRPLYKGDSLEVLLQTKQDQLFRERIPTLSATSIDIPFTFKHIKEEQLSKKLKTLGFFLTEMALLNSHEPVPGLRDERMPRFPLEAPLEQIAPAIKKTLHSFRVEVALDNLTEAQILNDVKPSLLIASRVSQDEA